MDVSWEHKSFTSVCKQIYLAMKFIKLVFPSLFIQKEWKIRYDKDKKKQLL